MIGDGTKPSGKIQSYLVTSEEIVNVAEHSGYGAASGILNAVDIRQAEADREIAKGRLSDVFEEDIRYWVGYREALKFTRNLPQQAANFRARSNKDG